MKITLIIIALIILTACQGQNTLIKYDNSYFKASPSATIEVTQELSVPANSARAYFQSGELLSHTGINHYNVSCEILVNTVSESRQIIAPGVFNVTSISQDESPIVMRRTIQVAALSFNYQQYALGGGGGGSGGDSPVDIHRYYRFKLSAQDTSKQKIQVRSLTCRGVLDEPYDAVLPTFNEMQAAVGQYVKFDLKLIDM